LEAKSCENIPSKSTRAFNVIDQHSHNIRINNKQEISSVANTPILNNDLFEMEKEQIKADALRDAELPGHEEIINRIKPNALQHIDMINNLNTRSSYEILINHGMINDYKTNIHPGGNFRKEYNHRFSSKQEHSGLCMNKNNSGLPYPNTWMAMNEGILQSEIMNLKRNLAQSQACSIELREALYLQQSLQSQHRSIMQMNVAGLHNQLFSNNHDICDNKNGGVNFNTPNRFDQLYASTEDMYTRNSSLKNGHPALLQQIKSPIYDQSSACSSDFTLRNPSTMITNSNRARLDRTFLSSALLEENLDYLIHEKYMRINSRNGVKCANAPGYVTDRVQVDQATIGSTNSFTNFIHTPLQSINPTTPTNEDKKTKRKFSNLEIRESTKNNTRFKYDGPCSSFQSAKQNIEEQEKPELTKSAYISEEVTKIDEIKIPLENDVICGCGKYVNEHPGNANFQLMILKKKKEFDALPDLGADKEKLVDSIIKQVCSLELKGRFLKRNCITGYWEDIGDNAARNEIKLAFRDQKIKSYGPNSASMLSFV